MFAHTVAKRESSPQATKAFEADILGPQEAARYGLSTWSLKRFQEQKDVPTALNCQDPQHNLSLALRAELGKRSIKIAHAPSVASMSANIAESSALTTRIRLHSGDNGIVVCRNSRLPIDGVSVEKQEGFIMSGAGCSIITAHGRHVAIVAHAGRDSLVERGSVQGKSAREHLSVVHAMLDMFRKKGVPAEEVEMHMHFAIPQDVFSHPYDHPEHGPYNRALKAFLERRGWRECFFEKRESLYLDIERLFTLQALEAGVRLFSTCAPLSMRPDLTHTRDGKRHASGEPLRNLIIVKRVF